MPHPGLGRRTLVGGAAAFTVARPLTTLAASLPRPGGKPILTVSGKISQTNDGKVARFDRPALESIGTASFTTSSPWYKQPMEFGGVPLDRLMQAVGASGDTIRAVALDDYASDLPISDFAKYGALLALKVGGEYIGVSEKGPCFIVYPFDRFTEVQNVAFYSRAVWQVTSIVVV